MTAVPQRRSIGLQPRIFEAKMCWKMNTKGRTEYKIAIQRVPSENFGKYTVNEQLTLNTEGLKDFFRQIKLLAENTKKLN